MRVGIQATFVMLLIGMAVSAEAAYAQPAAASVNNAQPELALDYNFVRSNAPVGSCGCFNLNGGSATFAWPLHGAHIALVGDVSVTHAGDISAGVYSLTLSTFTGGLRYTPRLGHSSLHPFGQVLLGAAHATGSLVTGTSNNTSNASAAFAADIGGGVDLRLTHHFSLRLVEADYLLTAFNNGDNDHQNNLRIQTGVVLRF